jgi:hypothetical protein
MMMIKRFEDKTDGFEEQVVDLGDADLQEALTDFKSSIHAFSDAAYSRSRSVTREVRVRSWRLAAGWALGCVLVAGSVGGGLMERQHRQHLASLAAQQRAAEQLRQLQLQEQAKVTDEALLADVDTAVSRQVPNAMEPLAQMMADDESK